MAGLYAAEQALVSLGSSVTGITQSYGLDKFFYNILPAELPCMLVVPSTKESGIWGTTAFLGNAPKHAFGLEHWLLYRQLDATPTDKDTLMPSLAQLVDTYVLALKGRPFLGNDLSNPPVHQPAKMVHGFGTLPWGEGKYYGFVFRYTLEVNL